MYVAAAVYFIGTIAGAAGPGGHTLLIVAAGFAVSPSTSRTFPYNTERDFA